MFSLQSLLYGLQNHNKTQKFSELFHPWPLCSSARVHIHSAIIRITLLVSWWHICCCYIHVAGNQSPSGSHDINKHVSRQKSLSWQHCKNRWRSWWKSNVARKFLPANPSQVKKEMRTQSALYLKICLLGHSVLLQQKVSHVCQTSCYRKNYYGQICEEFLSYLLE